MSLFDWMRRRTGRVIDHELGELEYRDDAWTGELAIGDETVAFDIPGTIEHPSATARQLLLELRERLPKLRHSIGSELLRLNDEYIEQWKEFVGPEFPRPSSPADALQTFAVTSISVDASGRGVLFYTYRDIEDDAMFELTLDHDRVTGVYAGD